MASHKSKSKKPKQKTILSLPAFRNEFKKFILSKKDSSKINKWRCKEICFLHVIIPMLRRHKLLPNQQNNFNPATDQFIDSIFGCHSTNCGIIKQYIDKYNMQKRFQITMRSLNPRISSKNAAMSDMDIALYDSKNKLLIKHQIKLSKLMAGAIKRYIQPTTTRNVVCTPSFETTELYFLINDKEPYIIMTAGIRTDNKSFLNIKTDKNTMPADVAPFWYNNWAVQGLQEDRHTHKIQQLFAIHNNKFVGDINDNLNRIALSFFIQNVAHKQIPNDIYIVVNDKRLEEYEPLGSKKKNVRFNLDETNGDDDDDVNWSDLSHAELMKYYNRANDRENAACIDFCRATNPRPEAIINTKLETFMSQIPKNNSISLLANILGIEDPLHRRPRLRVKYQSMEEIERERINDPLLQDYYERDVRVTPQTIHWDKEWQQYTDQQLQQILQQMAQTRNTLKLQYETLRGKKQEMEEKSNEMAAANQKQKNEMDKMMKETAHYMTAQENIRLLCMRDKQPINKNLYNFYINANRYSHDLNTFKFKTPWGSKHVITLKKEYNNKYKLYNQPWNVQHIDAPQKYNVYVNELVLYLNRNELQNEQLFDTYRRMEYQLYKEPMIKMIGSGMMCKQSDIIELCQFNVNHQYIPQLKGEFGVLAKCDIRCGTILGEFKGILFLEKEFYSVFTAECQDYNAVMIDSFKLYLYPSSNNGVVHKLILNTNNRYYETFQFATYINDPRQHLCGDGRFVQSDYKYWNVDFVVYYVNGFPRIFIIAKRDIYKGEELMVNYNGIAIGDGERGQVGGFWGGSAMTEVEHYLYKLRRLTEEELPIPLFIKNNIKKQNENNIKRHSNKMEMDSDDNKEIQNILNIDGDNDDFLDLSMIPNPMNINDCNMNYRTIKKKKQKLRLYISSPEYMNNNKNK